MFPGIIGQQNCGGQIGLVTLSRMQNGSREFANFNGHLWPLQIACQISESHVLENQKRKEQVGSHHPNQSICCKANCQIAPLGLLTCSKQKKGTKNATSTIIKTWHDFFGDLSLSWKEKTHQHHHRTCRPDQHLDGWKWKRMSWPCYCKSIPPASARGTQGQSSEAWHLMSS